MSSQRSRFLALVLASLPAFLLIAISLPFRIAVEPWGCTAWPRYHYELGALLASQGVRIAWLRFFTAVWLAPILLAHLLLGAGVLYFARNPRYRSVGLSFVLLAVAWIICERLLEVRPCDMSAGSTESAEAWRIFFAVEGWNE